MGVVLLHNNSSVKPVVKPHFSPPWLILKNLPHIVTLNQVPVVCIELRVQISKGTDTESNAAIQNEIQRY